MPFSKWEPQNQCKIPAWEILVIIIDFVIYEPKGGEQQALKSQRNLKCTLLGENVGVKGLHTVIPTEKAKLWRQEAPR
jgi:hypothetical protein